MLAYACGIMESVEKLMSGGTDSRKRVRLMGVRFITFNNQVGRGYGFACDWCLGNNHSLHQCANAGCPRGDAIGQCSAQAGGGVGLRPKKMSKQKAAVALVSRRGF